MRPELRRLIGVFLRKAKEYEQTTDSVLKQIQDVLLRGGELWIIRNGFKTVGYFFCEIVCNEYDHKACLIHELMIDRRHTRKGLVRTIDAVIEAWSKLKGVHDIVFYTRRDPHAFLKILGNNWRLDSWVMKRCVL